MIITTSNLMNTLTDEMIKYSTSLIGFALFLCGIGTLIYLIWVFIFPLLQGREISFEAVSRPFMLTLILMLYPEVMGAINGFFSLTTNEMEKGIISVMDRNPYHEMAAKVQKNYEMEQQLKYLNLAKEDINNERLRNLSTPDKNNQGAISDEEIEKSTYKIKSMQKQQETKWYHHILGSIFTWLVNLLTSFARDIVLLFSRLVLSLAIMVAPLAIAFSVFPNWQEGLSSFFSRLIGFYMWYPIALCLDLIFHLMTRTVLSALEFDSSLQITATIYISLIAIFTYFSIPAFAGWIVPNGGGDGGALAGIKNATSMAIGVATAQAGKIAGAVASQMSKKSGSIGGNTGSGGQQS